MKAQIQVLVTAAILLSTSAALADSPEELTAWTPLKRALQSIDHAAKESFSASFDRKKSLSHTVFAELGETIEKRSKDCASGQAWLKSHQGYHELFQGGGCQATEPLAIIRMKSSMIDVEIHLSAFGDRFDLSPNAQGKTTQCSVGHTAGSLQSVRCTFVSLVTKQGEELLLDELIYDQSAVDVVSARGKLYGLRGKMEEVDLRAPAKSEKIFVHLVSHEAPKVEEVKPEVVAEAKPKSDEEVLAEMENLASTWDVWQIEKAMHGDPEAPKADQEQEYLAQDFAEEEISDEELDQYSDEELEDYYNSQRAEAYQEQAAAAGYAEPSQTHSFEHQR